MSANGLPGLRRLDHIGITVPDLHEATKFFIDILGCEYMYSLGPFRDDAGDWMRVHLNVDPRTVMHQLHFFRCGGQAIFEVFEYGAVDQYSSGGYDFLVSVTPVDPHYFHWAVVPGEDSHWKMFFGTQYLKERTLLPPVYRPNGAIKIAKLSALATTGHFFGDSLGVVEIPEERSVHVALEFDLKLCETIVSR